MTFHLNLILSILTYSHLIISVSPSKKDALPSSMFMPSPSKAGSSAAPPIGSGKLAAKASLNADDIGMLFAVLCESCTDVIVAVRVIDARRFNLTWEEEALMGLTGRPSYDQEPGVGSLVLVAWTASRYEGGAEGRVNLGCNLNWVAVLNDRKDA